MNNAQLQKFLLDRQAALTPHFESGSIDKILKFYDPDLLFSDHAWHATNLTLPQFKDFLSSTYTTTSRLRMQTHGVHGASPDFCVWQWTLSVTAAIDDPIRGLVKEKETVLRGCSLHWWRKREGASGEAVGDWRIVREEDYACGADEGEGKEGDDG